MRGEGAPFPAGLVAAAWAAAPADPLAPPHPDWLRHALFVNGPAGDVAAFRDCAAGAGVIPWAYPDLEVLEEDQVLALIRPPDGSPGLRPAAARVLARQLRAAVETQQQRVLAAVGHSRACPFDLQALVPAPAAILERGPDDPASRAWLRAHWGTVQALHRVRLLAAADGRARRAARLQYEFWSADWTPWPALATVRRRWPKLVFAIRPDYGDA